MVLQRLQSLYLFIVAIIMAVYAFTSSVSMGCAEKALDTNLYLLVLEGLVVIMAIVTIFKYKNLKFQMTLCAVLMLITIALIASVCIVVFSAKICSPYYEFIMPACALILEFMAYRGIKSDKKKIQSSDSLR